MDSDSRLAQAGIFLLPVFLFISVGPIGRIFLPELFLLILLPFLVVKDGRRLLASVPASILVLAAFWLVSQIITDAVRDTAFQDWSRGAARICMFMVEFAALYLLMKGKKTRILPFLTGLAVGQILLYAIAPSEVTLQGTWKFGYGPPVTLLFIVAANIAFARRRVWLQLALLLAVGIGNLLVGQRSVFLVCFLAAGFVFMNRLPTLRHRPYPAHRRPVWPAVCAILILVPVVAAGYSFAAKEGWLGDEAMKKYVAQSGGTFGLLLGGRAEILASGQAIIDSPILGHGSYARDQKYQDLLDKRLQGLGLGSEPYLGQGIAPIPAHSYVFGSWVEAGILGGLFWLLVIGAIFRAAGQTYRRDEPYSPLFAFAALFLLWNILFSPFAVLERFYSAFFIVLVLSFATPDWNLLKRRKSRGWRREKTSDSD